MLSGAKNHELYKETIFRTAQDYRLEYFSLQPNLAGASGNHSECFLFCIDRSSRLLGPVDQPVFARLQNECFPGNRLTHSVDELQPIVLFKKDARKSPGGEQDGGNTWLWNFHRIDMALFYFNRKLQAGK